MIKISTTTVTTAGTEVQLSNTTNRVTWVKVKALAANSGIVYIGGSDVSATNGYELSAGNELIVPIAEMTGGSESFDTLYVDAATNGDKVCWTVLLVG